MIPTFGWAVIQRFSGNVSGMKKFAVCDFEQVLKACSIAPMRSDHYSCVI